MRIFKKHKKKILIILFIPILLISTSYLLSPPSGGRPIASKLNIPYPAVIAHRGASYFAPESTAPSYLLAMEIGADYLEMDVQRTKDGVLILFHDNTLERVTNVAAIFPQRCTEPVGQFTWAEIQQLNIGNWFNQKFPKRARKSYANLKIISFEQAIKLITDKKTSAGLYVEFKNPELYPDIESQVIAVLQKYEWFAKNDKPRVIFESFSAKCLARLRDLAPDVPRVYLINSRMQKKYGWGNLLKKAQQLAVGIGPNGHLSWPWFTGAAHRAGLLIHFYTINSPWQMRLVSWFGADGFFTDRCDLGLQFFGKKDKIDIAKMLKDIGY